MADAPSNQNVKLGRGEVLIDPFTTAGLETGLLHMGNSDIFEIEPTIEKISMPSSMSGVGITYAEDIVRTEWRIRIQGQEFHRQRMELLMLGTTEFFEQTVDPAIVDDPLATAAQAGKGKIFETGSRDITVTDVKQAPNTLVLGTDYVIFDAKAGLIKILATSPTVVTGVAITWSGSRPAITAASQALPVINAGTRGTINAKIIFIPKDPRGPLTEVRVWNASLAPEGPVGFISQEYAAATLVGVAQDDSAGAHGGSVNFPTHRIFYRG
jgi:hypothetical protein